MPPRFSASFATTTLHDVLEQANMAGLPHRMNLPAEELMLNAVTHSLEDEGRLTVQRRADGGLFVTVADSGQGIANSLRGVYEGIDDQLVRRAFLAGVSCTDDQRRGRGLTRVLEWWAPWRSTKPGSRAASGELEGEIVELSVRQETTFAGRTRICTEWS